MQTQTLPGTGQDVSRLILGAMRFGGSWSREEPVSASQRATVERIVQTALDLGITVIDHADIYCAGKSEAVFGDVLRAHPGLRQRLFLQSKCGIRFAGDPTPDAPARYDFSRAHIVASVEGSLRRLGVDHLDLLLLHRPDPLIELEEVAAAFTALEDAGKVRHFGVSNHTAAQIALLRSVVRQPILVNQVELSLLHPHLIDAGVGFNQTSPGPDRYGGTLEYCRQHGITVQAWSPLAKGAVVSGVAGPGVAPETAQAVAAEVARQAAEHGVSGEAIALAWLLRHPARIMPVIGTTNPARLRAAGQASEVTLTREAWYRLFIAGRGGRVP